MNGDGGWRRLLHLREILLSYVLLINNSLLTCPDSNKSWNVTCRNFGQKSLSYCTDINCTCNAKQLYGIHHNIMYVNLLSNAFAVSLQFTPFRTLALACIHIEHLIRRASRPAWTLTSALVVIEPLWGWATSGYAAIAATRWERNGSYQFL